MKDTMEKTFSFYIKTNQSFLQNIIFLIFFQVIGLQDHEMKWLCQHLGHTQKVHSTHYRATSGMIERIEISKLMLMQEMNRVAKFAGKNLKDIQFEGKFSQSVDMHSRNV